MSKFTDRFFLFPIKVYDSDTLNRSYSLQEDTSLPPMEKDWIGGWARVGYLELENMSWQDGYSEGRSVEDVKDEGFDTTVVYFETHGEFICTWSRKKFEEKLNDFVAKQPKEEREEDLTI